MKSQTHSLGEIFYVPCETNPTFPSRLLNRIKGLTVDNRHPFLNPLDRRWGQWCVEMSSSSTSRQPPRRPWTLETFLRERSNALINSVDISTHRTYSSALNSWIAFVNMHGFSIEPTEDTLSFFIVYMSSHISPRSVKAYLSGLVQQLEPDFPTVREIRASKLIKKIMTGCLKLKSKPIRRKQPLSEEDLLFVQSKLRHSTSHDDRLFLAILFTGFHGFLCLG
jgi:hypothetical protein